MGVIGERIAVGWLRRRGWRIVDTNRFVGHDEIDIVAESPDGSTISFVEVKSTRGRGGSIQNRVDVRKRDHLRRSAMKMASGYPEHSIRIDVITVQLIGWWIPRVRHFANVVQTRDLHASGRSRGARS